MSLVRASRSLACACSSRGRNSVTRCLSLSRPVNNQKKLTNVQNGFEGLNAGFVWDDKHGFGYNKDGELVLVAKEFNSKVSTSVPDESLPETHTESFLSAAKESYKIKPSK